MVEALKEVGKGIVAVAIKIRCLRVLWEEEAPKGMNVPTKSMVHLPKSKINSKYRIHFTKFAGNMRPIASRHSDRNYFVFLDLGNLVRKTQMLVSRGLPHLSMQNLTLCLVKIKCLLQIWIQLPHHIPLALPAMILIWHKKERCKRVAETVVLLWKRVFQFDKRMLWFRERMMLIPSAWQSCILMNPSLNLLESLRTMCVWHGLGLLESMLLNLLT